MGDGRKWAAEQEEAEAEARVKAREDAEVEKLRKADLGAVLRDVKSAHSLLGALIKEDPSLTYEQHGRLRRARARLDAVLMRVQAR